MIAGQAGYFFSYALLLGRVVGGVERTDHVEMLKCLVAPLKHPLSYLESILYRRIEDELNVLLLSRGRWVNGQLDGVWEVEAGYV